MVVSNVILHRSTKRVFMEPRLVHAFVPLSNSCAPLTPSPISFTSLLTRICFKKLVLIFTCVICRICKKQKFDKNRQILTKGRGKDSSLKFTPCQLRKRAGQITEKPKEGPLENIFFKKVLRFLQD